MKQSCVKFHSCPQIQSVIDVLCSLFSRHCGINKSFSVPNNFIWVFYLFSYSISCMLSQFHGPQACESHSNLTLEINAADRTILQSLCHAWNLYICTRSNSSFCFLDHISRQYSQHIQSLFGCPPPPTFKNVSRFMVNCTAI